MVDIPIFPLNMVLFPQMPAHLHIFEPRYKEMIQRCIAEDQPFGIVLIRHGLEVGGVPAEPHDFGCTARISRVEQLEDGRMNITAIGEERFRIRQVDHSRPYLTALVELKQFTHPCGLEMQRGARELAPWVRQYLRAVSQLDPEAELDLRELQLPEDPLMLMYLSAMLLQVPPVEKQPLLEAHDARAVLKDLLRLYRREAALLSHLRPVASPELN
jgi:Lon protease-like protein